MTDVLITVDTEGDAPDNPYSTFFGIEIVIPKLLKLFFKYNIKATFFIQEDKLCKVASYFPDLVDTLKSQRHEIGLHTHGLVETASIKEKEDIITTGVQSLRKLGFNPASFRAGKYYFNGDILVILEKNNIKYDSSVVPGLREISKNGKERCNHIGAPHTPYFPSYKDHCKKGNSKILELPINRYPKLPSNFNAKLESKNYNEEILFDYFYEIRKDKLIIISLHPWYGLSSIIHRFVVIKDYKRIRRFAFKSFVKIVNSGRLIDELYFTNFDNLLKYISSKEDIHFKTIKEAGESVYNNIQKDKN